MNTENVSEIGKRELCFTVEGSLINRIAREKLWEEHLPWDKIEAFLFDCMRGTEQTEEELRTLAMNVVIGRMKFVGNTSDGSYGLVDDDSLLFAEHMKRLFVKIDELEAELEELTERHLDLCDRINECGYDWLLEDRRVNARAEMSPLLKNFFKARDEEEKFGCGYGWLSPSGEFTEVEFGDHEKWAIDYVKERGYADSHTQFVKKQFDDRREGCVAPIRNLHKDFLVYELGFVLLENPAQGPAIITKSDTKRLSKKQKEFLFGYLTDRGRHDEAEEYLDD